MARTFWVLAYSMVVAAFEVGCNSDSQSPENSVAAGGLGGETGQSGVSLPAQAGTQSGHGETVTTGGQTSANTDGMTTGGRPSSGTTSFGGNATGGHFSMGGSTATGTGTSGSGCANFSFFVTSLAAMQRLSGNNSGFGGDLRFGKANGLEGADAICQSIATTVLDCARNKTWKAFLCTETVDAIDRVGSGPWYDKNGLKVWSNLSELTAADRPSTAYKYRDDLPNEDGIPNHDYDLDGSTIDDDNHDILTGCAADGRKIPSDTMEQRCNDWTSKTVGSSSSGWSMGGPMCGHSWPREGSGTNWISSIREGGCGAGINLQESGPAMEKTVGSGGGYGGIYCFATTP